MSAMETPTSRRFQGINDLRLVGRQVHYEQLSFWLNPIGAIFTIGFSTVFLLIFESTAGTTTVESLGGIKLIQYYVPGFIAYGIMSSCFSILSITIVNRREMGLLKRLRLSPAPTWILMSAVFLNTMIVCIIQIVLMLVVGQGFGVHGPANWVPFLLALGDQHRVLHRPGVLGALLPAHPGVDAGQHHRLPPGAAPDRQPPGLVQQHPGYLALGLAQPRRHRALGSRRRLRDAASLAVVTATGLIGNSGCVRSDPRHSVLLIPAIG